MADLNDLSDTIDEAASGPQQVTVDGNSVTARSLKELDDHYDRKANREAAASGRLGIMPFQLRMPGAADARQ